MNHDEYVGELDVPPDGYHNINIDNIDVEKVSSVVAGLLGSEIMTEPSKSDDGENEYRIKGKSFNRSELLDSGLNDDEIGFVEQFMTRTLHQGRHGHAVYDMSIPCGSADIATVRPEGSRIPVSTIVKAAAAAAAIGYLGVTAVAAVATSGVIMTIAAGVKVATAGIFAVSDAVVAAGGSAAAAAATGITTYMAGIWAAGRTASNLLESLGNVVGKARPVPSTEEARRAIARAVIDEVSHHAHEAARENGVAAKSKNVNESVVANSVREEPAGIFSRIRRPQEPVWESGKSLTPKP